MLVLLLIFLGLVFFFVFKFTAAFIAIVAIVAGTTTITILACVWLGTSYYLRMFGYKPNRGQQSYRQVDADLEQIVEGLQDLHSQLEEAEPHLRNMEFLKYARQNRETES